MQQHLHLLQLTLEMDPDWKIALRILTIGKTPSNFLQHNVFCLLYLSCDHHHHHHHRHRHHS